MRTVKIILVMSLLAVFVMPISLVLGGGEPPDPNSSTIVGPELWGVGVVDCGSPGRATIRIKRVNDCQVDTQAIVLPVVICPASEDDLLWQTWEVTLFGINTDPTNMTPIITKVKNFKAEQGGNIVSFDAQIKFQTPK
jgi:hypothetical protein